MYSNGYYEDYLDYEKCTELHVKKCNRLACKTTRKKTKHKEENEK